MKTNLGGKKEMATSANLAYNQVWSGYEWLRGFDSVAEAQTKQEVACAQQACLSHRSKATAASSCTFLSLLAHAYSVEAVSWLDKQEWKACSVSEFFATVRAFCRLTWYSADIWTFDDTAEGKVGIEHLSHVGNKKAIWNINLLMVQTPGFDSALHVLPIVQIKPKYRVSRGKAESGPAPPVPSGDSASPGGEAASKPQPAQAPDASASSSSAPDVKGGSPAEGEAGSSGCGPDEKVRLADQDEDPDWVRVLKQQMDKRPRFSGIEPPPDVFAWCHSPWDSVHVPRETEHVWTCLGLSRPVVCSALLSCLKKHGDQVMYLTPKVGGQLWHPIEGSNVITNNVDSDEFFSVGDVVEVGGVTYVCQEKIYWGIEVVELVRSVMPTLDGIGRRIVSSLLPFVDSADCACIHRMGVPKISEVSRSKAEWIATVHSEKEPLPLAIKQRLRQDAAAENYSGLRMAEADVFVKALAKNFPSAQQVAGIPKCYSCGHNEKGKYDGRLCKSCASGVNSQLGKLVADGHMVCGPANRVVYPGVVNTPSRHPPLKKGTQTLATGSNFQ